MSSLFSNDTFMLDAITSILLLTNRLISGKVAQEIVMDCLSFSIGLCELIIKSIPSISFKIAIHFCFSLKERTAKTNINIYVPSSNTINKGGKF